MAEELLQKAISDAGLARAFEVVNLEEFLGEIDRADAYDALANGSFYRFLESIVMVNVMPATWQKLADLGWSDDDIGGLIDGNILTEGPTTLVAAINLGALSRDEYDEFANYPNQEIQILYFAKAAYTIISWLQGTVTLPKISKDAFSD